jgi:hypothetical protein
MTAAESKYPYYAVHQMHPLLPSEPKLDSLRPLAVEVIGQAKDLAAHGMPHLRDLLREALRPMNSYYTNKLAYLGTVTSMERARFKGMMGLTTRSADRALADLFKLGIVRSRTPKGPVELALPIGLFRYLFPRLWPEAESNTTA